MDTFARALLAAQAILDDGEYTQLRKERYSSFDSGKGRQFSRGRLSLQALRLLAHKNGEPEQRSGRQEYFENLINKFI
jgi:xylose isomerase